MVGGARKGAEHSLFCQKTRGKRERERERERSVSDADASTYRPLIGRSDSRYVCPHRTHAKTTPHHAVRPSPIRSSAKRLTSTQRINPTQPIVFGNPRWDAMTEGTYTIQTRLSIENHQPTCRRARFGCVERFLGSSTRQQAEALETRPGA